MTQKTDTAQSENYLQFLALIGLAIKDEDHYNFTLTLSCKINQDKPAGVLLSTSSVRYMQITVQVQEPVL